MAVINTTINNGGTTQAASFSVDTEQIPGLIAKYEDARDELDKILRKTRELRLVEPPGEDEVSKAAAKSIHDAAGNGPGGLSKVVQDSRNHLQNQIDQLKAALKDYRAADEAATPNQA